MFWVINTTIRSIPTVDNYNSLDNFDYIFVDESQRIREPQLKAIVLKAKETSTPVIFSFDTKQYLRSGETTDIGEYVKINYPDVHLSIKKLTTKIRTNKEMASFITNLMQIGKSNSYLNYDSVTVDYMNSLSEVQQYIKFLSIMDGIFCVV